MQHDAHVRAYYWHIFYQRYPDLAYRMWYH